MYRSYNFSFDCSISKRQAGLVPRKLMNVYKMIYTPRAHTHGLPFLFFLDNDLSDPAPTWILWRGIIT